jgi:hypothetical protein
VPPILPTLNGTSTVTPGRQVTFGGEQICPLPLEGDATSAVQTPSAKKCERCGRSNNITTNATDQKNSTNPTADPVKPEVNSLEENEMVEKAKSMGQMLVELVQFTRGASELKTTQDYFTQAESLADEANRYYKLVRQFTYQVSLFFFFFFVQLFRFVSQLRIGPANRHLLSNELRLVLAAVTKIVVTEFSMKLFRKWTVASLPKHQTTQSLAFIIRQA